MEKILVCGDAEGNFELLFKRVLSVNKKNGPFAMLLCVGDFYSANNDQWIPYKEGKLKTPLPTFILGPNSTDLKKYFLDERGSELAENIIHLGPSGIYPCSNGLRIAYLSGKESSAKGISYGRDEILHIENALGKKEIIDILLTNDWAEGVCSYAIPPNNYESKGMESKLITHLVRSLKPRYHFAGSTGVHYERLPYRNHRVLKESSQRVTRFISLAKVGNPHKQKWLYAFNVTPASKMSNTELIQQPPDTTELPFSDALLRDISIDKKNEGSQFFYDMTTKENSGNNERGKRKSEQNGDNDGRRRPQQPTGPCWFCLSSPEVEKHLVVSVGTFAYLALAKGGLVKTHLLIMPIEHFQSTPDLEEECLEEISRFKSSLEKFFASIDHSVVFFERNYRTQHLQIQVVPVPNKVANAIKDAFMILGEELGCPLDEIPKHAQLAQLAPSGTPFFYAEIPTSGGRERLFHRIKKAFPIQFGREALAAPEILNLSDRVDWRSCKLPIEEETGLRDRVRTAYKQYDFTLDDDDSD